MIEACFFNQQWSDWLQHVAVVMELTAIGLVYRDYKMYRSDIGRQQRFAIGGIAAPKISRVRGLVWALVIGGIAVLFEFYQLLTQYIGC